MANVEGQTPHLVSVIVQGEAQPRGKVFPLPDGRWVLRRDVKFTNVLYKVAPNEEPPGGLTCEPEVLEHLEDIGVSELHYNVENVGGLRVTLQEIMRARWWRAGGRPQRLIPCYRWHKLNETYQIPEIPDHLVYICGQQLRKPGTGYGPNTAGGTRSVSEVTWTKTKGRKT